MLQNKILSLLFIFSSTLLLGSNVPKIPESELNRIINKNSGSVVLNDEDLKEIKRIYNIKEENTNFKVKDTIKEIKNNSFQMDSDFSREKSKFSLKNLLSELENIQSRRDKNLNRNYPIIFIAKDDMNLFLSNKEYNSIKQAFSINEAIQLINQYTGLSLSYKSEDTANEYAKIYNVGIWNHYDVNNPKKFLTLEPKNSPTYLYGSNKEDKAFFYFKNYNKQYNKDVYFDLGSNQILDLYEKLINWGVDKEYYNNILAHQFFKSTSNNKNFNNQKAYEELIKNPTISLIRDLKESINSNVSTYSNSKNINISNNQSLFSIVETLNLNGYKLSYMNSENIDLNNLTIQLSVNNPNITISSVEDLEKYYFFDKKSNQNTKFKIVSNSFLFNSPKNFIVHTEKDSKQQAIHYLDTALKNAKELKHYDFSYEIFQDDIKKIKKGLL